MANTKQHATTAALLGLGLGLLFNAVKQQQRIDLNPDYKFDWGELALCGLGGSAIGAAAGVLPDIIEPATNPNHRKFFHSVTTGAVVSYSMIKANQSELTEETKAVINIAGAGYLSHLLLDSETPKGIPLI